MAKKRSEPYRPDERVYVKVKHRHYWRFWAGARARATAALAPPRRAHLRDAALSGFRYLLALENGEPADPAVFVTAVPDWRPRMTFFASNGQLFRILAIEPETDEERSREPVGNPIG